MSLFRVDAQEDTWWVEALGYADAVRAYKHYAAQLADLTPAEIDDPEAIHLITTEPVIRPAMKLERAEEITP